MSDLEADPAESTVGRSGGDGPELLLIEPREVPLGGIRGIRVDRTLPDRRLPMVGAWCFLDRFDASGTPMDVLPHPHIGLQTVTWPLDGEIRHRDSLGSDLVLRPGQLNLMTSGDGIAHSEFSLEAAGPRLRGLQLWVALPEPAARGERFFDHYPQLPEWRGAGLSARVMLGELDGVVSPARVFSPIVGAELVLDAARGTLPLRPEWEHAVMLLETPAGAGDDADAGGVQVEGAPLPDGPLLWLGAGRARVEVGGPVGSRLLLVGGAPFAEELVMWWNFVGRSHDEVSLARADWESGGARFGPVEGHDGARIPAPPMPAVRLTPRRRRGL